MIYAGQFYYGDGTDDALWCQSANNGTNIGLWYYPNGTQILLFNGQSALFSKRITSQIALARKASISSIEGHNNAIIFTIGSLYVLS